MAASKKPSAKPIHEVLAEIGILLSEDALEVVKLLEAKGPVTEDKIAAKFSFRVNDARRILYALAERGVAAYEKSRDPKKKWWYIYNWALDKKHIQTLLINKKMADLAKLQQLLAEEQEFVFECKQCKAKATYSEALESDYACASCGEVMSEIKSSTEMNRLKKEIADLEREIVALQTSRAEQAKAEIKAPARKPAKKAAIKKKK